LLAGSLAGWLAGWLAAAPGRYPQNPKTPNIVLYILNLVLIKFLFNKSNIHHGFLSQ
jgi:hypothetical protein